MKTIWKFELKPDAYRVVEAYMPVGARILTVAAQHGTIMVWALVDPNAKSVPFRFEVCGTGGPFVAEFVDSPFLGTVFLDKLVFHVFGGKEKR